MDEMIEGITREAARRAVDGWPASRSKPDLWEQRAHRLVCAGQPPLPSGFSRDEQIRRLAALRPERSPVAVLACDSMPGTAGGERVSLLARAGEWLASRTGATVILAFPQNVDSLPDARLFSGWQGPGQVSFVDWSVGRPHPLSGSEQRLAAAIAADPQLRELFKFNPTIRTPSGATPKVDLAWLDGKLVVEVDSFDLHGTEVSFRADRQRDFELAAAGYTVLRLTNEEISTDVAQALEKIRTLVNLRRQIDAGN